MLQVSVLEKVLKRLSQISSVVKQERLRVVFFRVIAWIIYMMEGKLFAYFVGWNKAYVGRGSRVIGTRFISVRGSMSVGRYTWIEAVTEFGGERYCPEIQFGDGFHASERLHVSANNYIEIGDNCLFGSCVYVSDHNHGSYKGDVQSHPNEPPGVRKLVSHGSVVIGSNVWIGDNVTIVGPVRVGDGVVIGANSFVAHDVPDNVIVGGVPAKILKEFNFTNGKWEIVAKS